jgi:putative ABC transport system substrate-binding protein
VARAQQGERVRRIGVLMLGAETDPDQLSRVAAFREAFAKLGWAEGRNVQTDLRFAAVDPERIRSYSAAMLRQPPDVVLANGTPVLEAFQKQTRSIPIVFVGVSDPVSAGFVPNLARPGGNITGFSNFEYTIGGKWLEILAEAAPTTKRVAVLLSREDLAWTRYLAPIETLAPSFGVLLTNVFLDAAAMAHRGLIATLAARHRLPAIYPARVYVTSGGLMSYGIDPVDPYRGAASYVDRILRGEKPEDMPVQQPTKFEFVVNLKAARALGLTLSLPLIGRTDEVIE